MYAYGAYAGVYGTADLSWFLLFHYHCLLYFRIPIYGIWLFVILLMVLARRRFLEVENFSTRILIKTKAQCHSLLQSHRIQPVHE